jgi:DNA-binding response OmpR family regulator
VGVQHSRVWPSESDSIRPRPRVLVIDDDAWTRSALAGFLVAEGYAVEQAVDGPTGLQMAEAVQPDVMLLDLALPMRSGVEVLTRVKERQPAREIPVTIVSVYAMLVMPGESRPADRQQQPFDLEQLLGRVRRLAMDAQPPLLPPSA